MEQAANIQMQIRENTNELTDFLQDLNRWEEKIKHDDEELRISRRIDEQVHFHLHLSVKDNYEFSKGQLIFYMFCWKSFNTV